MCCCVGLIINVVFSELIDTCIEFSFDSFQELKSERNNQQHVLYTAYVHATACML